MAEVLPSLHNARPPDFDRYISQAMVSLGIKTTSKEVSIDRKGVIERAMILYTKHRLRTIQLPADAAWRSHFVAILRDIKPDCNIGRYIRNLQIFGCSRYLLKSSDASDVINLIVEHAQSLRLLYIWSDDDYIDWSALPEELRLQLVHLMQRVQVLVLERVENIPLSLLCSLGDLRVLDLALVQLAAPTAALTIMPGLKKMAVHGVVKRTEGGQGSKTLNFVSALMQSSVLSLNTLTTLYLDYLGCKRCSNVWKDIIERCRDTIQYLRLYCGDGTGNYEESIDLGILPKIRSLHLFVAANDRSVEFLRQLLNTFSTPGQTFSELKLEVDACETRDWSWTDNVISRNPESWKTVDEKLSHILELARRVQFILSVPEPKQTEREAAKRALVAQFPQSRRWLQLPVRFVAKEDSSFSLVKEEITTFT